MVTTISLILMKLKTILPTVGCVRNVKLSGKLRAHHVRCQTIQCPHNYHLPDTHPTTTTTLPPLAKYLKTCNHSNILFEGPTRQWLGKKSNNGHTWSVSKISKFLSFYLKAKPGNDSLQEIPAKLVVLTGTDR